MGAGGFEQPRIRVDRPWMGTVGSGGTRRVRRPPPRARSLEGFSPTRSIRVKAVRGASGRPPPGAARAPKSSGPEPAQHLGLLRPEGAQTHQGVGVEHRERQNDGLGRGEEPQRPTRARRDHNCPPGADACTPAEKACPFAARSRAPPPDDAWILADGFPCRTGYAWGIWRCLAKGAFTRTERPDVT